MHLAASWKADELEGRSWSGRWLGQADHGRQSMDRQIVDRQARYKTFVVGTSSGSNWA